MYMTGQRNNNKVVRRVNSGPCEDGSMNPSSHHEVSVKAGGVFLVEENTGEYLPAEEPSFEEEVIYVGAGHEEFGYVVEEDIIPLDIEQSKIALRRMSANLNATVYKSPPGKKPAPLIKDLEGLGLSDSDDDTIIEEEEEVLEEEITEIEEVVVDEVEVLEEIEEEADEVLEEIEEEAVEDEKNNHDHTEVEEEEDEEPEPEEEDQATEEEVRDAIVYILKQEKPIDKGHLTSEQATRMMALPFKDMKEIMKHFELCDNAGEPICWDLIAEIVTPEGAADKDDDDDEDEDDDGNDSEEENELCPEHKYSYCRECGFGLEQDDGPSQDGEEARDEVGSLGSGFDLNVPVSVTRNGNDSDVTFMDETDTGLDDDHSH